jgi:DNA-binding CsgD family transcriptional regulator
MNRKRLTKREYQTLTALTEYGTQIVAAQHLSIAIQTIKNHLTSARRKTGALSTAQLMYLLGSGQLDEYLPEDDDE